jgi:hypothetical protein
MSRLGVGIYEFFFTFLSLILLIYSRLSNPTLLTLLSLFESLLLLISNQNSNLKDHSYQTKRNWGGQYFL